MSAHFFLTWEVGKVWVPSPGSGPGALGKGHQKSALEFPVLLIIPLMGKWEIEGWNFLSAIIGDINRKYQSFLSSPQPSFLVL